MSEDTVMNDQQIEAEVEVSKLEELKAAFMQHSIDFLTKTPLALRRGSAVETIRVFMSEQEKLKKSQVGSQEADDTEIVEEPYVETYLPFINGVFQERKPPELKPTLKDDLSVPF